MSNDISQPRPARRSGRVPYRKLRREDDGRLYDHERRRWIGLEELVDDIRDGYRFRAYRVGTGRDCSADVLMELAQLALARAIPSSPFLGRNPSETEASPGGRRNDGARYPESVVSAKHRPLAGT